MKNLETLLERAIKIAHNANHEQVDKAGKPYIKRLFWVSGDKPNLY